MLLCFRVSKINEQAITEDAWHDAPEPCGNISARAVNRAHQLTLVFRIELGRYGCQSADLAGQDGKLPPLRWAQFVASLPGQRPERWWRHQVGLLHSRRKFVAHARNGEDEARRFGIWFNLATKSRHEHVNAAVVGFMIAPRDRTAQLIAR